jgi:broad specificity phosphatase PhoE
MGHTVGGHTVGGHTVVGHIVGAHTAVGHATNARTQARLWRAVRAATGAGALAALMLIGPDLISQPATAQQTAAAAAAWTAPQRRRIILMRHGDVAYFDAAGKPVPDPDKVVLSEKGRAQADATGKYLQSIGITKFDRVISSDLARTIETAERTLSSGGFGGKPTEVGALREMRNGPSKDIATADLPAALLALTAARASGETKFLGRESVAELQARIGPALKALLDDTSWDTSLLVLHALVNNAILSTALTGDASWYGRFDHGPGCFTIIDVGTDFSDAVVKAVNVCADPGPYATRLKTMESLLSQALKGR